MGKNTDSNYKLKYDVIIVGGGPAGSTAAYLLARKDVKVLVIDKENFPRSKPCGGLLSEKAINIIKNIYGSTVESFLKQGVFSYSSNNFKFFYKTELVTEKTLKQPLFFVNRENYDYFLLNKAREAGAEVLLGEAVKDIDFSKSLIMTSKGKVIQGKFIIGADGVYSIIRKKIFFLKEIDAKKWTNNLAITFQINIPRNQIKKETKIASIYNSTSLFWDFVKYGYSWVFPDKDIIKIGIGGLQNKNKLPVLKLFYNFLSFLEIDKSLIRDIKGFSIPFGCYLLNPIKKNFVLIGDAAGFVDPLIGEGIYYAHRSAELISYAILKNLQNGIAVETLYLDALNEDIFPQFNSALGLRNFIFTKLKFLPKSFIMNALRKKDYIFLDLVSGKKSYSHVLDKIKKGKPLWKRILKK